ncbi:SMI1/KNR4 family protein [Psychrobacillus sp. NEAU-3TGS]|uniref:SMI1/KNR4 family protein n=1 Tax=Psychrobacillus sp. NEAU-3TGS TaxID=2995412 RepID=UPI002497AC8D|nr:SMI1/KNR4 family protein [Psychrobacillus sp. NEAU-3TGS]MDI2588571.1 SMI1/KNR4 family protein [Psychrobacillus sp. NEAU-3TGS]
MNYFEGFSFENFWDEREYARNEYTSNPPTARLIQRIETELGYKLPASYIWLMKQRNGGIPTKDCHSTRTPTSWAEDHISISGIYGIGYEKNCSLGGEFGSKFWIDEWEYPDIGIAICDCPSAGHDMIFLDYRKCGPTGEPCVVHVDQENDYKITFLAKDFESFIKGLTNGEIYESDDTDQLSRNEVESVWIHPNLDKRLKG